MSQGFNKILQLKNLDNKVYWKMCDQQCGFDADIEALIEQQEIESDVLSSNFEFQHRRRHAASVDLLHTDFKKVQSSEDMMPNDLAANYHIVDEYLQYRDMRCAGRRRNAAAVNVLHKDFKKIQSLEITIVKGLSQDFFVINRYVQFKDVESLNRRRDAVGVEVLHWDFRSVRNKMIENSIRFDA